MQLLEISHRLAHSHRVRRLAVTAGSPLPLGAAFLGDDHQTHSIAWLNLPTGLLRTRHVLPVFPGMPQPALSHDLLSLAFVIPENPQRIQIARFGCTPFERGRITLQPLYPESEPRRVVGMAFSHIGDQLGVSLDDGEWQVYELGDLAGPRSDEPLEPVHRLVEEIPPAPLIVASPTTHFSMFLTCTDATVCDLIRVGYSPELIGLNRHLLPGDAVFSADGRWLALAYEGLLQFWEIEGTRGRLRRQWQAHDEPITALAFAPNDLLLASTDALGRVRTWHVEHESFRGDYEVPFEGVGGLVFTPDGQSLLAGGANGQLALWTLPHASTAPALTPPPPPPPAPTPRPRRRRERPEVAPAEMTPLVRWVYCPALDLPPEATIVGHEADGQSLYAARVSYTNAVHLGKVRYGFGGANVVYNRREMPIVPFEVLTGPVRWVPARGGAIPEGATPSGHDRNRVPRYLVRARLGNGIHPGQLPQGATAAQIPYGGTVLEMTDYEVMIPLAEQPIPTPIVRETPSLPGNNVVLLSWDFENTFSERGLSTAVGLPSDPSLLSGFLGQTGGGPAEHWPNIGMVFVIRHFGTNELFLWLSVTRPVWVDHLRFRHWHNHNPGFPTDPSYEVQLYLEGDDREPLCLGEPLVVSNDNSGQMAQLPLERRLAPGNYRLRWRALRFARGRDSGSEFFALREMQLVGQPLPGEAGEEARRISSSPDPEPYEDDWE